MPAAPFNGVWSNSQVAASLYHEAKPEELFTSQSATRANQRRWTDILRSPLRAKVRGRSFGCRSPGDLQLDTTPIGCLPTDLAQMILNHKAAIELLVSESENVGFNIRLQYRTQLADVIARTVRAGEAPSTKALRQRGKRYGVPIEDLVAFAEAALKVLLGLHEGSAGRYGLKSSEFTHWKRRFVRHAGSSSSSGGHVELTCGSLANDFFGDAFRTRRFDADLARRLPG